MPNRGSRSLKGLDERDLLEAVALAEIEDVDGVGPRDVVRRVDRDLPLDLLRIAVEGLLEVEIGGDLARSHLPDRPAERGVPPERHPDVVDDGTRLKGDRLSALLRKPRLDPAL